MAAQSVERGREDWKDKLVVLRGADAFRSNQQSGPKGDLYGTRGQ